MNRKSSVHTLYAITVFFVFLTANAFGFSSGTERLVDRLSVLVEKGEQNQACLLLAKELDVDAFNDDISVGDLYCLLETWLSYGDCEAEITTLMSRLGPKAPVAPQADGEPFYCSGANAQLPFGSKAKVLNLGPDINSKYAEYNSVFDSLESVMMYTARRDSNTGEDIDREDGQYFEDMYISEGMAGAFSTAVKIDEFDSTHSDIKNTSKHESPVWLTYDQQQLITFKQDKLWLSDKVDGVFQPAVELPKEINSGRYQNHASLPADGSVMYFSKEVRDPSRNDWHLDIFRSYPLGDGKWSKAEKLSSTINTQFSEDSPMISADGKTLYFSSKGHEGYGGYDIFVTELQEDSTWSVPVNLCPPINSSADDVFFRPNWKGNGAYLSSSRLGGYGKMDIYKVVFDKPLFENCGPPSTDLRVSADAAASEDPMGSKVYYEWDMGDGKILQGPTVEHQYKKPGFYKIRLHVTDSLTGNKELDVQTADADFSRDEYVNFTAPEVVEINRTFEMDGSMSYVQDMDIFNYYWDVAGTAVKDTGKIYHSFDTPGQYEVVLEVAATGKESGAVGNFCVTKKINVLSRVDYLTYLDSLNQTPEYALVGSNERSIPLDEEETKQQTAASELLMAILDDADTMGTTPAVRNDVEYTQMGQPVFSNVLKNDVHPDGVKQTITAVTNGANGTVEIIDAEKGMVKYTPNPNFAGTDVYSYTVIDEAGNTTSAVVVVNVGKENIATALEQGHLEDDRDITMAGRPVVTTVFRNDHGSGSGKLQISEITQGKHGKVRVIDAKAGTLEYTPEKGYVGTDEYTYSVMDEQEDSYTAKVSVMIMGALQAQKAARLRLENDLDKTFEGMKVITGVLENDLHPDGLAQKIIGVSDGANGSVRILNEETGEVEYTPAAGFIGTDTYTYTIRDENGNISTAAVTVHVTGEDGKIVGNGVKNDEDVTLMGRAVATSVMLNDDPNGSKQRVTKVSKGANGIATIVDAEKGIIEYIPNPGFTGVDAYTYTVTDENGNQSTAAVRITVSGSPDDMPQSFITQTIKVESDQDETMMGEAIVTNVFKNDIHPEGISQRITAVTDGAHGKVRVIDPARGTIRYAPDPGYVGTDAYTYTVTDANGLTSSTIVAVRIKPPAEELPVLAAADPVEGSEPKKGEIPGSSTDPVAGADPKTGTDPEKVVDPKGGADPKEGVDPTTTTEDPIADAGTKTGDKTKTTVPEKDPVVIPPQIDPTDIPDVKLIPIYFNFDKSNIRKDADIIMETNVRKLRQYKGSVIKVIAHTDSRGSNEYNVRLSERRARAVVKYLEDNGIDRSRILAVLSQGESKLVNDCGDDEKCSERNHQLNRRAELQVVGTLKK